MLVDLVYISSITLKDAFVYLRSNLGDLPNQRRPTVATEIIRRLNVRVCTILGTTTNIMSPL